MTSRRKKTMGTVALVGAGPGDPGLVTVRGRDLLAAADVVVVDRLVAPQLLLGCRPDVEVVDVSTAGPGGQMSQAEINAVLVARAKAGLAVVRLQGGDPFVFGGGSEEAEACVKAGIAWEVVPGVTAATAVPAFAGIPVTHRGITADVAILSGPDDPTEPSSNTDWSALAAGSGTLVLLMGVERIGKVAAILVEHGRPGDTPVAMTRWGTTADQRTVVATLDTIEHEATAAGMTAPAVTVIGEVVRLRERLSWWESRPLFGMRVLVPRTRQQAGELSEQLRTLGATPVELPTIAIEAPRNPAPMERAVAGLVQGRYAWVAFTSTNSVRAVRERLEEIGLDARVFSGVKIAAVGDATTAALLSFGLRPDLVPTDSMSSEAMAEQWPWHDDLLDPLDRVLLPRADIATEILVTGLKAKGWAVEEITAYRTVRAAAPPPEVRESVRAGGFDAVVFTSSSTVRNLLALAGRPAPTTVVAAIGPQTAATATELGLHVDVIAETPSVAGLAAALAAHVLAKSEAPVEVAAPAAVSRKRSEPKKKTPAPKPGKGAAAGSLRQRPSAKPAVRAAAQR
ncbi:MAG TPA: uroporphyrinogen-III C-methyltransferase [Mycobacteriales bacterium]|nr:uroporphyrinogen-III C-methyltransferase [Mycobacteriales bacterium]